MKKHITILLFLLATTLTLAQKREKIKGSKKVTIEQKEVGNFETLEVNDNLEIYLEKGDKNSIKIEADENLHEVISVDLTNKTLRLYTSKEISSHKKLLLKVTYTNDLNTIVSKNEATINAIQPIQLENITFKSLDNSKLYLNVNTKNFTLESNDKSKTELNLKSENANIQLSKNTSLEALIATTNLKCDLYQKSNANIEGNSTNATIRLDNNSSFIGNKFTIKNADLKTENYANCSLFAETTAIIDAADKSEIHLFGTPKIELRNFTDEAKLLKKKLN